MGVKSEWRDPIGGKAKSDEAALTSDSRVAGEKGAH